MGEVQFTGMLSEGVLRQRQERNAADYGRDLSQSPDSFVESRPKRRRIGILRKTEVSNKAITCYQCFLTCCLQILRGGGARASWLEKDRGSVNHSPNLIAFYSGQC